MSYEYDCRYCGEAVFSWDTHSCAAKRQAQSRMPKTWQLMNELSTANVVATELSPKGNVLVEIWFRPKIGNRWQKGCGCIIGPVDEKKFDMLYFFRNVMRDPTHWPWMSADSRDV